MEASPSPVHGARLLSGFGATTPSRVQIPPPPPAQPNPPPGSPAGSWRAPLLLQVCAKRICAVRFGGVDRDPSLTLDKQRPGRSSGSPRKSRVENTMGKLVTRFVAATVAAGLTWGAVS